MMVRTSFIALVLACVLATGSASAFTYDSRTTQKPDGSSRFTDPDDKLTGNGKTFGDQNGRFSLRFSTPQSDQSGVRGRFVPSQSDTFSSPFTRESDISRALNHSR